MFTFYLIKKSYSQTFPQVRSLYLLKYVLSGYAHNGLNPAGYNNTNWWERSPNVNNTNNFGNVNTSGNPNNNNANNANGVVPDLSVGV